MNVERSSLTTLVVSAAKTVAARELPPNSYIEFSEKSALFGGASPFDSLALVSLVVECERLVEQKCGHRLSLADERAMSQPVYPFSSVAALADYIGLLLSEK